MSTRSPAANSTVQLLRLAKEVLTIEAEGIASLIPKLNENFARAVQLIYRAKGRLIVTGIGKSGIVGRKIVATLNSTGTPACFYIRWRPCMATWG